MATSQYYDDEIGKLRYLDSQLKKPESPAPGTNFIDPNAENYYNTQHSNYLRSIQNLQSQKDALPKLPEAPPIDQRAAQSVRTQKEQADQFRASIPEYSKLLTNEYERNARRDLAENLTGIKHGYNTRGMLFSGQRMGAESKAKNQAATDYATTTQKINAGLLGEANNIESGALNSGFGLAGLGDNSAYNNQTTEANNAALDIGNMHANQQALGSLGQAAGQIGGAAIYASSRQDNGIPPVMQGYYNGVY